jgi:hypothetical protein
MKLRETVLVPNILMSLKKSAVWTASSWNTDFTWRGDVDRGKASGVQRSSSKIVGVQNYGHDCSQSEHQ